MTLKDFIEREKQVVLNAQSRKFRIGKWTVIIALLTFLYFWKGIAIAATVFLACAVGGTSLHFFFRWKTEG